MLYILFVLDKIGEHKPVGHSRRQACYCSWSHMDHNSLFPGLKFLCCCVY